MFYQSRTRTIQVSFQLSGVSRKYPRHSSFAKRSVKTAQNKQISCKRRVLCTSWWTSAFPLEDSSGCFCFQQFWMFFTRNMQIRCAACWRVCGMFWNIRLTIKRHQPFGHSFGNFVCSGQPGPSEPEPQRSQRGDSRGSM